MHIYKLVYSSDLDYKVRKEIVKMIVVQNRTFFPLSRNHFHFVSKVGNQQHRTCGLGGGSSGGISGSGCNDRILLDNSFLKISRGIFFRMSSTSFRNISSTLKLSLALASQNRIPVICCANWEETHTYFLCVGPHRPACEHEASGLSFKGRAGIKG